MDVWSMSTEHGVVVDAERLVDVLVTHHDRLVSCWRGFSGDQWEHPSRNATWSVHDTVRHVADGVERGAAVCGGEALGMLEEFDPRSTPLDWLHGSDGEAPSDTIARFVAAASRFRDVVRSRLAAGDDARSTTVYGEAHWTINVVHLLWDSWLHERDVCVPLGLEPTCPIDEERIVALYGVLMAGVPMLLSGQELATTMRLTGRADVTLTLRCDGRELVCSETPGAEADAAGDLASAVDAISGRGQAVDVAVPGARPELGFLAAFMNS